MQQIGHWIVEALDHRADTAVLERIRRQVLELCEVFPLYSELRQAHAGVVAAD